MKRSFPQSALVAAALLLCASLSLAVENKPAPAAETKAIGIPKAADEKAKAKEAKAKAVKAAAKIKVVDINSAGKTELKTLPGIGDAEAEKIIAGRPYLSKANLVTHDVLSREIYDGLKTRVIAKQNQAAADKLKEKQRARGN